MNSLLFPKFVRLVQFCRETKHPELNRNAWKTFYELIRYHPGFMEDLTKSQKLGQFLDVVVTGSGHMVIANGLHYISRVSRKYHFL